MAVCCHSHLKKKKGSRHMKRVGIDLGTTYTEVSYYDTNGERAQIIKNKYGNVMTPSVVGINDDGKLCYGDDAKELQEIGEGETVSFYKREMGNKSWKVQLGDSTYNAEDLSAIFLRNLINELNEGKSEKITEAVITVPAYFNELQRSATARAGETAGLKVLDIVNEPTAAAVAFGLNKGNHNGTYMVYDLGGGTFDVTIVKITNSDIETVGTTGDHRLGGKNWDDAILEYVADLFNDEFDCDLLAETDDMYDLLVRAEKLKKNLTEKTSDSITIIHNGKRGKYTVTREMFNQITESYMYKTELLCNNLLEEVKMNWQQISGVLLVGGSTKMVMVHDFVKRMSGKEPVYGVNVNEAVSLGAAIVAEMYSAEEIMKIAGRPQAIGGRPQTIGGRNFIDATAHALGRLQITKDGNHFFNDIMINKNTKIPCEVTKPSLISAKACRRGESDLYILQGDLYEPQHNIILEKRVIEGIEIVGNKDVIIDVTYKYDKGGRVQVEAVQQNNRKKLGIRTELLPEDMSWMAGNPNDMPAQKGANEMDVVMCLDTSGSMYGAREEVKKAAKEFVNQLDFSYAKVAIVEFETDVHLRLPLTDSKRDVIDTIESMGSGGGTEEPMSKAYELLSGKDSIKYVVVLTDGEWCNADRAKRIANNCKKEEIDIISIGLGSCDYSFLNSISTTDAVTVDPGQLVSTFSTVGREIAKKSNAIRGF